MPLMFPSQWPVPCHFSCANKCISRSLNDLLFLAVDSFPALHHPADWRWPRFENAKSFFLVFVLDFSYFTLTWIALNDIRRLVGFLRYNDELLLEPALIVAFSLSQMPNYHNSYAGLVLTVSMKLLGGYSRPKTSLVKRIGLKKEMRKN